MPYTGLVPFFLFERHNHARRLAAGVDAQPAARLIDMVTNRLFRNIEMPRDFLGLKMLRHQPQDFTLPLR